MLIWGYFDIPFQALAVFVIITLLYFIPVLFIHGRHTSTLLGLTRAPIADGGKLFVGHALQMIKAEHFGKFDYDLIKKYGRVFGICEFSSPVLVVSNTELLKDILVHNFDHFTDRRSLPLRGLMKLSMFDQKGLEWRRLRALYTPFFSTVRLKQSLVHMQGASERLVAKLEKFVESGEKFEAQSVCNAFSLDVICGTAFGIQVDAQLNPHDEFLETVDKINNVSFNSSPILFLTFVFPFLSKFFEFVGISMFPRGYFKFFEKATNQMIEDRRSSNTKSTNKDFVETLMKAHQHKEFHKTKATLELPDTPWANKALTDREIAAQCLLFTLAGSGTTSQSLAFLLYNLAVHPHIQEHVAQEVNAVLATEKSLTYDAISKLEYLDQCLCESLRLYPPAYRFDREASSDIVLEDVAEDAAYPIPQGNIVVVPVWAIHHDPEYWPHPEKFDPDRFTAEAKQKHNPYVYLPFGVGSRSCIGIRFAQIELKLAVAQILRSFKISASDQMQSPVRMENGFFLRAKDGLWLNAERRIPLDQ